MKTSTDTFFRHCERMKSDGKLNKPILERRIIALTTEIKIFPIINTQLVSGLHRIEKLRAKLVYFDISRGQGTSESLF